MIKLTRFKCINEYNTKNIKFISGNLYYGTSINNNRIKIWDENKRECIFQILIPCHFRDNTPNIEGYFKSINEKSMYLKDKKELNEFRIC